MTLALSWLAVFGAGFFLGLFGGGGGLLLLPALTLGFGLTPTEASFQSILLVGTSCLIATAFQARLKQVEWKKGIIFSMPAVFMLFVSREMLSKIAPDPSTRDRFILYFFLSVVSLSAYFMIRPPSRVDAGAKSSPAKWLGGGLLSGVIMGVAGAAGGFVIVPSLNVGLGIPVKKAIGTSVWVIAFSSSVFFLTQWVQRGSLDGIWDFSRSLVSWAGVPLGVWLGGKIPSARLRPAFGVFALCIALLTLVLKAS